jgi:4-hydroxy-tetrahydrodipicolinate synthase
MSHAEFLHGSMVALLTPMTDDEQIDFDTFDRLIDLHVNAGTRAIVVASTTGEGPTLAHEEHVDLYRRAVLRADGRIPIIAGVGSPSTRVACELAREAEHARVNAVLCVTPYYNRPNEQGLERHFITVAEAVDIPVVLYDVPRRTGVSIPEALVVALSRHPNIVGLKDATGNLARARRLIASVAPGFHLISGDDPTAFALMAAGGTGVISVAANVAPASMVALCDAVLRGAIDEAAALDNALRPLYALLGADTNPVPAKWLAQELGMMRAVLRAPLSLPDALVRSLAESVVYTATRAVIDTRH